MRKVALVPGTQVTWDGDLYELVDEESIGGIPSWRLRRLPGKEVDNRPVAEVQRAYDVGELVLESREAPETSQEARRRRRRHGAPLSDMPKKKRTRIAYRKEIINEVERRLAPGMMTTVVEVAEHDGKRIKSTALDRLCKELGCEIGTKYYGRPAPCSAASYYRWRNLYAEYEDQRDLQGDFDRRGRHDRVHPLVKKVIRRVIGRLLEAAKFRKPVGRKPLVTVVDVMTETLREVKEERRKHPDQALDLPKSKTTFYNLYNEQPACLREIAKYGATKARMLQRRPWDASTSFASLSCLQFDETRLPCFVVHEKLGIPLGRPWLAILVDEFSASIVGFYIGFEPPSDLVIAATLRHACLMKGYVAQVYPDITSPYHQGGVGRFITFDNSLQAHAASIHQITADLDVPFDFTPSRSPWVKGEVEGAFEVINKTFLSEMPGYVLSPSMRLDHHDYDPAKHAVIGLGHLIWLWHHWLLDIYHATATRGGMRGSPNERWLEGTRKIKPSFIERGTDLDFLFGIVREGRRLDFRGVAYESLYYYSDGVDILRHRRGNSIKVKVKVNPLDLSRVHVWDHDDEIWIPAYAREAEYATGMDLHMHQLHRREARRQSGQDSLEAMIEARLRLRELIASSVSDALGIGVQTKIARAIGIGTHRAFALLDHDGRLPSPPVPASEAAPDADSLDSAAPHVPAPRKLAAPRQIPQFKSSRSGKH